MAKDYKRGDDYYFYLNTGSQGTPTWTRIKAVADLAVDDSPADIVVPEQGISDGHLAGFGDPSFTFTLFEDNGDTNVGALITAMHARTMKELAIANGPIATVGTKYFRLESLITGMQLSAGKGEPASYDCEARRHANSDFDISRNTAA